ncbi:MAG: hypothetical protein C5B46_03610 [Proteobacteria bacterium]|nr:MAG: hypothetical protein C5B46_03610 [Pseudomonadota bacterium]
MVCEQKTPNQFNRQGANKRQGHRDNRVGLKDGPHQLPLGAPLRISVPASLAILASWRFDREAV